MYFDLPHGARKTGMLVQGVRKGISRCVLRSGAVLATLLSLACDGNTFAPGIARQGIGADMGAVTVVASVRTPDGLKAARRVIGVAELQQLSADITAHNPETSELTGGLKPIRSAGERGSYLLPDGSTARVERLTGSRATITRITMLMADGRTIVAELTWVSKNGRNYLAGQSVVVSKNGEEIGRILASPAERVAGIAPSIKYGSDVDDAVNTMVNGPSLTTAIGACAAEVQAAQDAILYYWSVCVAVGVSVTGGPLTFIGAYAALYYAANRVDVTQAALDQCVANI